VTPAPAAHQDRAKRALDVGVAAVALVVTAPVQVAVAVLVACSLGRPVLFRQMRPGLHERPFELVKFRTMLRPDQAGGSTDSAVRLTGVGRLLRAASLDELPTLWNVLRGEMSLVGPRPLLVQYLERYDPWQRRRHEVRPGVTGLAQVRGRNALSWDAKLAADVEYVDRRCLALDLRLLAATVLTVLRHRGVSADGHPTMPEFRGPQSVPAQSARADFGDTAVAGGSR
jgi:lipopolysaccharide/colanic/teichoic acid biosynthesis glycosyltransferase